MANRTGGAVARLMLPLLLGPLSAACGSKSSPAAPDAWTPGVYAPAASLANLCAAPRTGSDPLTGWAYPDRQGTGLQEKLWLRSWIDDTYLWYQEVPDLDPAGSATPTDYFGVLKTSATTPSGTPVDHFHFTYPTLAWEAMISSGSSAGYGATFVLLAASPPRSVVVAYTEPGSPAEPAVARGAQVLKIDGVDVVYGDPAALNAGLFPAAAGETHVLQVLDLGAAAPRDVTLVSADVVSAPVQNVRVVPTASGPVGYLTFNDHIATAQEALRSAVLQLQAASPPITDLVIDLRYNGGGYLVIAAEAAYLVAGPAQTAGKTFELTRFNDKHPAVDPITGAAIAPTPFQPTTVNLTGSQTSGTALPHLDLARVFVLTGPGTCSASEAVLNGLAGIGVQVIQIGATTCGKPYGFYPADDCGTTYFSIQFRGVNQLGYGDYSDGFSPANSAKAVAGSQATLPGCEVADDFGHALGDPAEARLAAALAWRATGSCPAPAAALAPSALARQAPAPGAALRGDGEVVKPEFLRSRILTP